MLPTLNYFINGIWLNPHDNPVRLVGNIIMFYFTLRPTEAKIVVLGHGGSR